MNGLTKVEVFLSEFHGDSLLFDAFPDQKVLDEEIFIWVNLEVLTESGLFLDECGLIL